MSGAGYYQVYRAATAGGAKAALSGWISATTYDDTTATPGVTYYYSAQAAVDASGTRPVPTAPKTAVGGLSRRQRDGV